MITVEELRYRISATDTGFRQVMANAIQTVQTYHQRVQEGARVMRNWGLAATGVGSAIFYAMKRIVDSTGQAASSVRDVANQIGVATTSLQRLRFAAQENGLAMQQLDAAMRAFVRRSAEAARGNQAFLSAFERIGITQEEVQAKLHDTEELFLTFAEAISKLPTTAEQSAVAMALLGDVGRQMVPMLAGGRQEIERLMRDAEELGIVLERDNIERFAEYDSAMSRFRTALSGLRMQIATTVLPIFEQLARGAERNIRGVVSWVRENRDLIAQGVVLVSTFTALATGLGAVALGASLGVRALGLLTTAISFLMSPLGLLITLAGLLAVAWAEDWGGIRKTTEDAVNFIRNQWDRLKQWWDESDLGKSVRDWWAKVVAVWESDELTLPEKTVEIARLIPGIGWVVQFVDDLRKIWADEELTLPEKAVASLKLIPGVRWVVQFVEDVRRIWDDEELTLREKVVSTFKLLPGVGWIASFVAEVRRIWNDEELTLPEKVAEIVRLIPGVKAIEEMIAQIKEIWQNEELSLPEKVAATFRVVADTVELEAGDLAFVLGAAVTAPTILRAIGDAIRTVPGVIAITQPGNILRLGIVGMVLVLGVYGWRLWIASKDGEEELKAEAERITSEALAAGIEIGLAVNAIRWTILQAAAIRQALLKALSGTGAFALVVEAGVTMLNLVGALTVGLTIATAIAYAFMPDEEKEVLKARIQEIWNDEELALSIKVARIALEILDSAWSPLIDEVDEKVFRPIRQVIGTEASEEGRIMQEYLLASPEQRQEMVAELRERLGETQLRAPLPWWRAFLVRIGLGPRPPAMPPPSIPTLDEALQQPGLQRFLDAIYHVEGGEQARVPYGMTGFAEAGNRFLREENQRLFETLISARQIEEGTREFYEAAAAVSVLHYWRTFRERFPEVADQTLADLSPELIRKFIEHMGSGFAPESAHPLNINWVPNMIDRLGVREGGRVTGEAWAEGLRDSVRAAETAAEELAQSVADYLIGQSPPPKGPLSEIDEGGARTIGAWFDGIRAEIAAQGGGLTATLRVLVERMFDGLIGIVENRYPELAAFLKQMRDDMRSTLDEVEQRFGGDGGSIADGIRQIREESILWTDQLVRGLSDAVAYGRSLTDVFDQFLRMLASQFLQTRVFGPLLAGWFPGVLSGLPIFHAGGLVLGGAGALVLHDGGIVSGLRSDEVPAILQIGERVLSRAQNDRFERLLDEWDRSRSELQEVVHVYHINAVDAASFVDLARRHPEAITTVVLGNIAGNGELRKAIRAVSMGR